MRPHHLDAVLLVSANATPVRVIRPASDEQDLSDGPGPPAQNRFESGILRCAFLVRTRPGRALALDDVERRQAAAGPDNEPGDVMILSEFIRTIVQGAHMRIAPDEECLLHSWRTDPAIADSR